MKISSAGAAFAFLFFASMAAKAQLRLPVTSNDLRNNLQKVIADFPNGLSSLKAGELARNPQTVEYATQLRFETAEENTITQYISQKEIYSWQAVVLTTEDFEEAGKKYKWLCNQLQMMTIQMDDGYSFSMDGEYEEPVDSKKFSVSTYHLTPSAVALPKLKIEAGLQYQFPEWKVILTVYQREREDDERGERFD